MTASIVVITRDLMDAGRFRAAVPDPSALTVVRGPDHPAVEQAEVVVLDLATVADPAPLVRSGRRLIAYAPHVDTDALAAAEAAGCDEALPRSVVFRRAADRFG